MNNNRNQLLILHGALGSSQSFNHLINEIPDYYEVFVPDLPGHGSNCFISEELSMDLMSNYLIDYMKENSLIHPKVFGYSMGGYLACYHESKYQLSFSSIITLGTKFDWNKTFAAGQEHILDPAKLRSLSKDFFDNLNTLHQNSAEQVVLQTIELMKKLGDSPNLDFESVQKINIPVFLCLGDKDKMVSLEETKRFSSYFNNSTFHILENTSHPIEKLSVNSFKDILSFAVK